MSTPVRSIVTHHAQAITLGWCWLIALSLVQRTQATESLAERRLAIYQPESTFDPSRQYFFVPSELTGADSQGGKADVRRAEAIFALAEEALSLDQGQLAFRLAHETLQFDQQHADARRWLGLPPDVPTASLFTMSAGRRPHARFGWPAREYRQVSTPHFQIATNDDPRRAEQLARVLEETHAVWEQVFFDCWSDAASLRARQQASTTRRPRRARHLVVMFRDREEYLSFVRTIEPRAELTRGYYHAPTRTSYFAGGDSAVSTWRHEVTHQLFHERLPTSDGVGSRQNCWIIEGVAMYLESLQPCRQWLTVGGLEAERLQQARFRALRGGDYLPWAQLAAMGQDMLQADPEIARLYSQAAGLTHFLMHAQTGRFRGAGCDLIRQVYQQRDTLDTLPQLTGMSWDDLDHAYKDFLQVTDSQLSQLDPDVQIRELCLGGTLVSDAGLRQLPPLAAAVWLDLFATRLTDGGTEQLSQASNLELLTLAQTEITDATVARLNRAEGLQQLDLSGTRISDAALETVGRLSQLQALWLSGTQITDEGLRHLEQLKQLRTIGLSGTRSTQAGRDRLHAALPQVVFE